MAVSGSEKERLLLEYEVETTKQQAEHAKAIVEAHDKLNRELEEKLDKGLRAIDVTIEFKNRLWSMQRNGANIDNPEYVALKNTIAAHDAFIAEEVYRKHGWRKKFSGEWVKAGEE